MHDDTCDREPLATPDDVARAFFDSGEPSLLTWRGWSNLRQPKRARVGSVAPGGDLASHLAEAPQ
jgi:hypothetical protein